MSNPVDFHAVLLSVTLAASVGGCGAAPALTAEDLRSIDQPSASDAGWLESVAPGALTWLLAQEATLSKQGRPLTADEIELARRMGVRRPEKVRVVVLASFPLPNEPRLAQEVRTLGLGSDDAGGFGMGYVVLLKPRLQSERWLLAHELVHVAQRERLGAQAFVRRYLLELRTVGYRRSPLEMEANRMMAGK